MIGNNEDGSVPKIENIILLGFPQTEIHVEKLKEFGFAFDRLIYLTCTKEEETGKEVVKRNTKIGEVEYSWEAEDEEAKKIRTVAETLWASEENPVEDMSTIVKEVDCNGTEDEVFIKIRTAIDPFFLKPDNPDNVVDHER
jgi:adenylate/nucleoside-diphosphate kinase